MDVMYQSFPEFAVQIHRASAALGMKPKPHDEQASADV
jgi:hypothetical protein